MKIFGKTVRIFHRPAKQFPHLAAWCDVEKYEITIHKETQDKFQSLCHEMFHLAWNRVGKNQTSIPHDLQELIVENFATVVDENFDELVKWRKKLTTKQK